MEKAICKTVQKKESLATTIYISESGKNLGMI